MRNVLVIFRYLIESANWFTRKFNQVKSKGKSQPRRPSRTNISFGAHVDQIVWELKIDGQLVRHLSSILVRK